jgi:UDP-N-acetylmuramoyl-tripeptide--D-alanyl-D-alanine ligase
MTIEDLYQIYRQFPSVQTDSRKLRKGDLFFALKGDQFNGNRFAQQAIDQGAAYAIVDEPVDGKPAERFILVDDVLATLQLLAAHHRRTFSIPFLAITGSNGKTTTKELIHAVLSATFITYSTEGNLNNHIGIPLTLLKIRQDAQLAVIEMGANHLKEIEGYCRYTLPTHGLITNCGKAHLEGFGSVEGVRRGKGELYDYLRSAHGTAFVNWDYAYLKDMSRGMANIITYGTSGGQAAYTGHILRREPTLGVRMTKPLPEMDISTRLAGDYNLPNLLAAVSVGRHFNVPVEKIQVAIEQYMPANSRSQLMQFNSNRIILDAYNANPSSMQAAIENFARLEGEKKILILGAMAELGAESLAEHQQLIQLIGKYPWTDVVLVGGDFEKLDHPYRRFTNSAEAKVWFGGQQFHDTLLLIKGSRSMKMERILES